jgi:pimeloyl-ACP methyl ester carboxylesterase
MVASMYAGTFPDRVSALILLEGFGPPAGEPGDMPSRVRQWIEEVSRTRARAPRSLPDLDAAAARLQAGNPRLDPATARRLAQDGTVPAPDGGVLWSFDPLHRTRSPQPFLLAQAEAFWRNIRCPTTLVVAEHSGFRWNLDEIRRSIPQTSLIEIPGAGHMMHHETPAAVAAIIRKALP